MQKLILQTLIAIAVFGAIQSQSVYGCMCGNTSISEMYKEADVIVIAKVKSFKESDVFQDLILEDGRTEKQETDGQKVKLQISKSFKGNNKLQGLIISQPNSTCDKKFYNTDKNKEFLFYLAFNKKYKTYSIISCGRSTSLNNASDDLSWLSKLPKSLNRTRISGSVQLSDETNLFPSVGGIKINILVENKEYNLITDKNGVYEVWDLPAGKYKINAEVPQNKKLGWTSSVPDNWLYFWSFDKPNEESLIVTLEANSSAGVDFMLQNK